MKIFGVSILAILVSFGVQAAEVEDVKSRGETTRLLVEKGNNPSVTVVLFAGGKGAMDISESGNIGWGSGNFLIRSRQHFQNHGAITVVIDAPTDKSDSLYEFRGSEDHAKDVGAVIKHLRVKYGLPVWLVGTSRGTNSVANAAVKLQGPKGPDGIVLSATMLAVNSKGDMVLEYSLSEIRIPVLVVHHKKDACSVTPPDEVGNLKEKLKNAKPVKVLWYEGGSGMRGRDCQAFQHHGFVGIEEKVVADTMAWIKAPTP